MGWAPENWAGARRVLSTRVLRREEATHGAVSARCDSARRRGRGDGQDAGPWCWPAAVVRVQVHGDGPGRHLVAGLSSSGRRRGWRQRVDVCTKFNLLN